MVSRPDCRGPGERQRWNLVCGASAERFGIRLVPKQSEELRPKQCGIQQNAPSDRGDPPGDSPRTEPEPSCPGSFPSRWYHALPRA